MSANEKSCLDCPSYMVGSAEQAAHFGKAIGAPRCARRGIPLGMPKVPEASDNLLRAAAANCEDYRKSRPAALPEASKLFPDIVIPDMEAMTYITTTPEDQAVSTCRMCRWYIPDSQVMPELGYSAGLCSAKGKLIPGDRLRQAAEGCTNRKFKTGLGPADIAFPAVQFLPLYENAKPLDPAAAIRAALDNLVDPTEYPTDAPVSDKDRLSGIRAYRRVTDPEGSGNSVLLPIYEVSAFSEEEQAKIPRTGDDEHPELYVDHSNILYTVSVLWRELDETPALHGIAGTGKTEFFRWMAWLMCLPFERISITEESEVDDLIGKMEYSPDLGTYPHYGRLPRAWQKPCVIVLDEPNTGPPAVWQSLRPLTDNSKQLVLDALRGERIPRHNDCYLGMAMNPAWDVRNKGAAELADADGSRLSHISVELPPYSVEKDLLRRNCEVADGYKINEGLLESIMLIAADLRELSDQGTLPITWGIRQQIKVARGTRFFKLERAYQLAAADYINPSAKQTILDVVTSHTDTRKN
jgi:hypothetical protein